MAHTGCNRRMVQALLANTLKRTSRKNHHQHYPPWELGIMSSSRSRYLHSSSSHLQSKYHPDLPTTATRAIPPLQPTRNFFSWSRKDSHKKSNDPDHDHHDLLIDKSSNTSTNTSTGLFGKLKQLTKLYGSAALVVYGVLGAVDFGLAFLTIYLVGEEHVRRAEDWLLDQLNWKRAISQTTSTTASSSGSSLSSSSLPSNQESDHNNMLWTTAVVAYTIHKTVLLPVRLGLTAWITPPIVRALRKRGWKLGRNLE